MLMQLENLTLGFEDRTIFENVCETISEGDKIGLVGANGIGKTTLLRTLTGTLLPDSGFLHKSRLLSYGYLAQNAGFDSDKTIEEELRSVYDEELFLEKRMRELEHLMASVPAESVQYRELSQEYTRATARFEAADGYHIGIKIKTVINGMGFADRALSMPVSALSGGEKTRLALARLLLQSPDLLILDEPTNHLDFTTLSWLEDYLSSYKGALLLVSHDRYFLDKMVNSIWELENKRVNSYRGNYSKYKLLKKERMETQKKEYEKQQREIAAMEEYAERNIARASTSQSAKSRLHRLANMERIEKPFEGHSVPFFSFSYERDPVSTVLTVSDMSLTVGSGESSLTLFEDASFEVKRSDRIGIVGKNGAGKSTLLRTLIGELPCSSGDISWGKNVLLSYYDQENRQMHPDRSVMDELWERHRSFPEQKVRSLLGQVLLQGEDVFKQVAVLSGGEKAKLGFALMMAEHGNTLILDEPTNHLDLAAREALEAALLDFPGTVFFVSHDRYFLNAIATKTLEIEDKKLALFDGNYDAYLNRKAYLSSVAPAEITPTVSAASAPDPSNNYYRSKQQRAADTAKKRRISELEKEIARTEEEIEKTEAFLASPEAAADYVALQETCGKLEELRHAHEEALTEWMELSE